MENPSEVATRARAAWDRAIGLIGHFDLDPNRVLDIILDVFSAHVTYNWAFFIALLDCSPWARPVQSATPKGEMDVDEPLESGRFKGKSINEILTLTEARAGASVNDTIDTGFRVLAQVVGFKFTWHQVLTISTNIGTVLCLLFAAN
jgi:THO complex subunit 2